MPRKRLAIDEATRSKDLAGSPRNRPQLVLDDLNYQRRDFNNMRAYGEAKVATVLYAAELAERLAGTGVSTFSVHPGWARSNFGSGASLPMRIALAIMRPLSRLVSDSNEESARTTLHCLLSDDAPRHSGAYFSQWSILYRDKQCRAGGWPMETPNPNAKNMDTTAAVAHPVGVPDAGADPGRASTPDLGGLSRMRARDGGYTRPARPGRCAPRLRHR